MDSPESRQPKVVVVPSVRFGRPHVHGVSVVDVAGMVWAGETVESAADEYGLNRGEVILACWFEAQHGTHGRRRHPWRRWVEEHATDFGHERYEFIPGPPDRTEVKERRDEA